MNEPTVCCVMLTRDRPELAKLAVECFQKQTYANKRMCIINTDSINCTSGALPAMADDYRVDVQRVVRTGATIGSLRNEIIEWARSGKGSWTGVRPEIIVHWDDDDWSHQNRIAEQVALLQASGAECVGYNEMLFWRSSGEMEFDRRFGNEGFGRVTEDADSITIETGSLIESGEAWLYTNRRPAYALGTSLCYWRKTWEAKPFPNQPRPGMMEGEDVTWLRGLKVEAVSSSRPVAGIGPIENGFPRMIARIHGGNSSGQYADIERSGNWKRVPEWDARVREVLA